MRAWAVVVGGVVIAFFPKEEQAEAWATSHMTQGSPKVVQIVVELQGSRRGDLTWLGV
jgi:hypothetical protein